MRPLNPNGDLLRSTDISELVHGLIRDMRDGPDTLVFLLSQQPDNYDAITAKAKAFGDAYITFSPHTVFGIKFALWILEFDSSGTSVSAFSRALAFVPFDEAGIYVSGKHVFRLLPNEELFQSTRGHAL